MGGSASSTRRWTLIERGGTLHAAREARPGGEAELSDTRASSERRTRFSDSRAATCSRAARLCQRGFAAIKIQPGPWEQAMGWVPGCAPCQMPSEDDRGPLLARSDALVRLWILRGAVADSKRPSRSRRLFVAVHVGLRLEPCRSSQLNNVTCNTSTTGLGGIARWPCCCCGMRASPRDTPPSLRLDSTASSKSLAAHILPDN